MLSLGLRALTLTLLLLLQQRLLRNYRAVEVSARQNSYSPAQRAALVTLSDRSFQHCAVSLIRNARATGWRHVVVLLAVDYASFSPSATAALDELGVLVIHTHPAFDSWFRRGFENIDFFRALQPAKFRKMELFLNPILRSYERLVFVDADGVVDASLDPLLSVPFPDGIAVLMRQNDMSVGKHALWPNEIAVEMLTDRQLELLASRFPNRVKTGGSCWFVVDVRKLHSPAQIMSKSLELLCTFRAGFRFNDQTLISLLFYDSISLFPWCVWDEVPVLNRPEELNAYCKENQHLQRWINGELKFMYRHLSVQEKAKCVSPETEVDDADVSGPARIQENNLTSSTESVLPDHQVEEDADCMTALAQWRKRLPAE